MSVLVTTWKIELSSLSSLRFAPHQVLSGFAVTSTTTGVDQFVQSNVIVRVAALKRGSVLVTMRLSSSKNSVTFTFE